MAIPSFDRNHVLDAIEQIRRSGVPDGRDSTKFSLVHEGTSYPPKYVVQLAVKLASGRDLGPSEFYPSEANSRLIQLGFTVVSPTSNKVVSKRSTSDSDAIPESRTSPVYLDENQVVHAVCSYLEQKGYDIQTRAHTTQRGVDIEGRSRRTGRIVQIEAKGGISSKPGTRAYGIQFDKGKVSHQVAQALFTALHLRAKSASHTHEVAVAVPGGKHFRSCLEPIHNLVNELDIGILFVGPEGEVAPLGRDVTS